LTNNEITETLNLWQRDYPRRQPCEDAVEIDPDPVTDWWHRAGRGGKDSREP
jgi:hypothetical protein